MRRAMRVFLLVVGIAGMAIALQDLTIPYNPGTTIKKSDFVASFDTVEAVYNRLNDSLDGKFVRYTNVKDSTFQKIKVDSIRSNPTIDSIQGSPVIATNPVVTGTLNADSVKSTKGLTATGGTFSSTVTVDSLRSAKAVSAPRLRSDSATVPILTGNVTLRGTTTIGDGADITSSSVYGVKFRSAGYSGAGVLYHSSGNTILMDTAAATFTGVGVSRGTKKVSFYNRGAASAYVDSNSNATFSGAISVDSVKSWHGINGNAASFSSTVTVDSLKSTKGVNATGGTFSSTVTVDSLKSTKGVNATTFTGNLVGSVTGNVTGNATGSSGSCTGNAATATTAGTITATKQSDICTLTVDGVIKATGTLYYCDDGRTITFSLPGVNGNSAGGLAVKLLCPAFASIAIDYQFIVPGTIASSMTTVKLYAEGTHSMIVSTIEGTSPPSGSVGMICPTVITYLK